MNLSDKYTNSDLLSIAKTEYEYHPLSNLRDYCKLFFQSYYGQGHFISDEAGAKRHLDIELEKMNCAYLPMIQDISNGMGLYRISLDAITNNLISIDDFLLFFLNRQFIPIDWEQWTENWHKIMVLLFEIYPDLNDTDLASECTELTRNKSLMSHSECFRLTYCPHYRVMQLSETDEVKFKKLMEYL